MTYHDWLMRHQERKSRLGDLARYAAADKRFPQSPASLPELVDYLNGRYAPENIVRGAKNSWLSWRRVLQEERATKAIAELREVRRLLRRE